MRKLVVILMIGMLLLPAIAQVGYAVNPFVLVYGGPEYEAALGVAASGGGVYTVGATNSTTVPGDFSDGFIVRHMPSGIIEWAKLINMSMIDFVSRPAVDSAGNVYVAGHTGAIGPDTDLFMAFMSSDGSWGWILVFNDTPV
ncbi:MAG: hypothetical protein F7C08_03060 [Desulfurococcales archaeon]|nr:hypothetical protein [Desulfurococcales archaeon]